MTKKNILKKNAYFDIVMPVLAKKIGSFFIKNPVLYILSLWLCIIIITLPNLNRPLSKHHEFNPSLVLICIDNWQAIGGPQNAHFTPLINYQNNADKLPGFSTDKLNQYVNVSFGNLWYLAPYYFHTIFGLKASALSLQVYNLLLLFISLLLISKISIIIGKSCHSIAIPLLVPLLYATCPVVAWFCTNGYVHEVAVLPFYFGTILLLYKMIIQNHYYRINILWLMLLFVAGTLTDWLFAPFCCIICIYAFITFIRTKEKFLLAIPAACITGFVIALIIIFYCYSQQMGVTPLLDVTGSRWQDRGINIHLSLLRIVKSMSENYLVSLAAFLPAICLFFIKNIRKNAIPGFKNSTTVFFVLITVGTGLLHHVTFLQFSYMHDYSPLKMAFPFALVIAVMLSAQSHALKSWATIIIVLVNISFYYAINKPGKIALNGDNYNYLEMLGKDIAKSVSTDEIIIIKELQLEPQIMFYSKRNYISVEDEKRGLIYMKKYHFRKGCFIVLDNWKISAVTHLIYN